MEQVLEALHLTAFHPLIDFLGILSFFTLAAGGIVCAIVWFWRTFWKEIIVVGVALFVIYVGFAVM